MISLVVLGGTKRFDVVLTSLSIMNDYKSIFCYASSS
jgi:hypothetical protein